MEKTGTDKDGEPVYLMHLDRLARAMEKGEIEAEKFDWISGGKIICPLPYHNEKTPSMAVYLRKNYWRCFGKCNTWGRFSETSVPKELSHIGFNAILPRKVSKENQQTNKLSVPEEHHKIMTLAQEILQRAFSGGKDRSAEIYLANERFLDPDLAFQMGAGYGDDSLMHGLLDSGYTYDDLIHYGFVGISARISALQGISPLLKKRGFNLKKIKRDGLPYSILRGRLTFPLDYEGRRTNFYGRAVKSKSKKFRHRKLPVGHTRIHHGGFNMSVLQSDCGEVKVVEGIMCVLTLIQMGVPAALAFIGVNNTVLAEAVARSGKNVAIAFDGDEAGDNNTKILFKRLADAGLKARVRDFTAEFIKSMPNTVGFKDYNDWWIAANRAKYK